MIHSVIKTLSPERPYSKNGHSECLTTVGWSDNDLLTLPSTAQSTAAAWLSETHLFRVPIFTTGHHTLQN